LTRQALFLSITLIIIRWLFLLFRLDSVIVLSFIERHLLFNISWRAFSSKFLQKSSHDSHEVLEREFSFTLLLSSSFSWDCLVMILVCDFNVSLVSVRLSWSSLSLSWWWTALEK
jgi:hypothetical protein